MLEEFNNVQKQRVRDKLCLLGKGVVGEERSLELHRQEVRNVQRLKDIKATPQGTRASKVYELQEAVRQEPSRSSDKLHDNMPHD